MTLGSTTQALSTIHDLAMLDLDGVVYLGADPIEGVAANLQKARKGGLRLAYITNNASRTAKQVADKLRAMDMPGVLDEDVVTSAQALAHLMAGVLPAGASILLVGGEGLRIPLEENGFVCVSSLDEAPVAVAQGFHADVGWHQLAEASYAIQSGLPWFASNTDLTVPTARGIAPGNGSLVQAIRFATGAEPVIAGKPERALFDETIARIGGSRPLMIGDRLDTDIDGAINAGIDSLAVLTGVSSLRDVVEALPGHRPTYIASDLRGLLEMHPEVTVEGGSARCADAVVELVDGTIVARAGEPGSTTLLRAAVGLAWQLRDRSDVIAALDGTLEA